MKWTGISGSWRKTNELVEADVKRIVREIVIRGYGIVTGGALGVDYIATDEALKLNPSVTQIRVYLPTTLQIYSTHYRKRAAEGVITNEQAEMLMSGTLKTASFKMRSFPNTRKCTAFSVQKILLNEFSCIPKNFLAREKSPIKPLA